MKRLTEHPDFSPLCVIFLSLIFPVIVFCCQLTALCDRFCLYGSAGLLSSLAELRDDGYINGAVYSKATNQYLGFFRFVYRSRYIAIVLTVILSAVFFIAVALFLSRAGKAPADARPGTFDRVPPDIALALWAIFAVCTARHLSRLAAGMELSLSHMPSILMRQIADAVILMLATLWLLHTAAVRLRRGPIWRGAVLLRLWRVCSRGLDRLFDRAANLAATTRPDALTAVVAVVFLIFQVSGTLIALFASAVAGALILAVSDAALVAFILIGSSQLRVLILAGEKLASGQLQTRVDVTGMYPHLRRHGEDLSSLGDGLSRAVDQRLRSERMRAELITNVSHDIKTPLTSIISYVDLLQKPHSDAEGRQYLEVLARQSAKLRSLINDLVDAGKASSGVLEVELAPTDLAELMTQAVAEYSDRLGSAGLSPLISLPETPVAVMADGRHLWRILDNLLGNIVKYAMPGTRVYIDVMKRDGSAVVSLKNISRERLDLPADELMERFVRGDRSRGSEGSGLGLSIAGSLAELMGGSVNISVDGDLFKALVELKLAPDADTVHQRVNFRLIFIQLVDVIRVENGIKVYFLRTKFSVLWEMAWINSRNFHQMRFFVHIFLTH